MKKFSKIFTLAGLLILGVFFMKSSLADNEENKYFGEIKAENVDELQNKGYELEEVELKSKKDLYLVDSENVKTVDIFLEEKIKGSLKKVGDRKKYKAVTNDTFYEDQWNLTKTGTDKAWTMGVNGSTSNVVAVLDTGMCNASSGVSCPVHEEFTGRLWANQDEIAGDLLDNDGNGQVDDVSGWNFVDSTNNPAPLDGGSSNGNYTHGTMVAGVIAATSNNVTGIAGMDTNTKIMPLRVMDNNGEGWTDDIAAAIEYAADNGAKVINMSLGYGYSWGPDAVLESAISYANGLGVVMVAASGNDYGRVNYPAASPNVIAVGASDQDDLRASFSSYGPELDVVAPGTLIPTTVSVWSTNAYTDDVYAAASGTSLASPQVAGLVSLLIGQNSELTPAQITSNLRINATKVTEMSGNNFTDYYGYGRINAENSARSVVSPEVRALSHVFFNPWPLMTAAPNNVYVDLKNFSDSTIALDGSSIGLKNIATGAYMPFNVTNTCTTINSGETCRLEGTVTPNGNGTFYFWVTGRIGSSYFTIDPDTTQNIRGNVSSGPPKIKATSHVFFIPWPLLKNQSNTVYVDLKNFSTASVPLDSSSIGLKNIATGAYMPFNVTTPCATIASNATCRLEGTVTPNASGYFYFWVTGRLGSYYFTVDPSTNQNIRGNVPVN